MIVKYLAAWKPLEGLAGYEGAWIGLGRGRMLTIVMVGAGAWDSAMSACPAASPLAQTRLIRAVLRALYMQDPSALFRL